MPIYLYRCETCRETHEALQKVSDDLLKVCPHCGEEALRKLIAPAGVIFKGSGFHKNDYSSTGRKGSSKSGSTTSSTSTDSAPKESPKDSSGEKKSEASGSDKGDSKGSAESKVA